MEGPVDSRDAVCLALASQDPINTDPDMGSDCQPTSIDASSETMDAVPTDGVGNPLISGSVLMLVGHRGVDTILRPAVVVTTPAGIYYDLLPVLWGEEVDFESRDLTATSTFVEPPSTGSPRSRHTKRAPPDGGAQVPFYLVTDLHDRWDHSDSDDDGGAFDVTETRILCSRGPSGVPSCLTPIVVKQSEEIRPDVPGIGCCGAPTSTSEVALRVKLLPGPSLEITAAKKAADGTLDLTSELGLRLLDFP
jgi:hypothetical protein